MIGSGKALAAGIFMVLVSLLMIFGSAGDEFRSTEKPLVPMSELPLWVSQPFSMVETSEKFIFSGAITNSGNEDIVLETLYFTFRFGLRYIRTDGYTNLVVPANGVLNFYEEKNVVFYGAMYDVDYQYVKVRVLGTEQYLWHSDYNTIQSQYDNKLKKQRSEFESARVSTTVFGAVICVLGTALICGFVLAKRKSKRD